MSLFFSNLLLRWQEYRDRPGLSAHGADRVVALAKKQWARVDESVPRRIAPLGNDRVTRQPAGQRIALCEGATE